MQGTDERKLDLSRNGAEQLLHSRGASRFFARQGFGHHVQALTCLLQDSTPISLQHLTCTSHSWSLSQLQPSAESASGGQQQDSANDATSSSLPCDTVLQPNSRASLFCYLHPCSPPAQLQGREQDLCKCEMLVLAWQAGAAASAAHEDTHQACVSLTEH